MKTISAIYTLIRPYQWIKNLFIFLPIFFHGSLFEDNNYASMVLVFLGFSLIASSIYCLNDIIDIEMDRLHPKKSKRPLASGELSKNTALILHFLLLFTGLSLIYFFSNNQQVIYYCLFYYFLNIAYCLYLKKLSIIDVIIISSGFVIRLFIGSVAANIELSKWIIIMTFLLALFLSFGKRRDDLLIYNESGKIQRQNVLNYNLDFVNITMSILSAVIIVAYLMYTLSPEVNLRFGSDNLFFSFVFVLMGILRYLQLTLVFNESQDPGKILLRDTFLQITIALWILFFGFLIYLK